jgi:hypothetical protein
VDVAEVARQEVNGHAAKEGVLMAE